MSNAFAEIKNGIARAVKRPSTVATFAALEGGAGSGQGLFSFSTPEGVQTLVGIQNDVLNNSPTSTATRLRFTTQPVDWKIDTAMTPSVVVKAYDSFGNIKTSFTGDVTISFYDNPNGGALSGTLTVTAVSGVATFSNLKIDKVGGGYSFVATSPFMKFATSSTFKIISNLSFTIQPNSAAPNDPIVCTVSAVDASSGVITGYTGNITIAIGNNPSGGTLSGTLTAPAVAGVASFSDLSIDQIGNGYTLVASETTGGMTNVTSGSFSIADSYELTISADTADYNVYTAFVSAFGAPPSSVTLSVTVNTGVIVSASSTGTAALTWSNSWGGSPTLSFINNGYVVGKGGTGGNGALQTPTISTPSTVGSPGGKAIELSGQTVSITNALGFIWGGGGGGGGGALCYNDIGAGTQFCGGGGGAGGAGNGTGGAAGTDTIADDPSWTIDSAAAAGFTQTGSLSTQVSGAGGAGKNAHLTADPTKTILGSVGGASGAYGAAGSSGAAPSGTASPHIAEAASSGGAAGKAINKSGGTANFLSGSGSPNVKGVVS